jgi:hypothetical protein
MKKLTFIACTVGLAVHQLIEHEAIKLVERTIAIRDLPAEFTGFRIAHISDLHGKRFGKSNIRLAKLIDSCNPDVLCMTGDMVNGTKDDGSAMTELLMNLKGKYPRLYVSGNHENRSIWLSDKANWDSFSRNLESYGTSILNGSSYCLEGLPICFHGMKDSRDKNLKLDERLGPKRDGALNIALIHRPSRFEAAANAGYDLILSGHIHGGVIRIPYLGGLLSPDKALFPKYDKGIFRDFGSALCITSGLGNTRFYPKLMNRPEVVLIRLLPGEAI